jgi:hypothetical protein
MASVNTMNPVIESSFDLIPVDEAVNSSLINRKLTKRI